MTKSKKKLVIIGIAVIVIAAIIYFAFSRKGKEQLDQVAKKVNVKPKTVSEKWKTSKSEQFSKEVFVDGEKYYTEVKSINGKDYALMPDESVVVWVETGNGIVGPHWEKASTII